MSQQNRANQDGSGAPATTEVLPATAEQTRMFLVERSGRAFAPIPKTFVQDPNPNAKPTREGPLADFVHRGDKRGLITFLLLHTIISSGEHELGWSATFHLQVWARALDTTATATGSSASSAATKVLSRLVDRNLVERHRTGRERKVRITLLSADGQGRPYTRPTGATEAERFLRLSHQFWIQHWDSQLSLPAIAMLLVALHAKPVFPLPTEHMPTWYGWSADTAERGLHELNQHGLVNISKQIYTDAVSPTGISSRNIYTVLPPFDQISVDEQAKARR